MIFPMLSFLQLSNGSAKVLTWLVNIMTAGGLIDYLVMNITFINYYRATQVQGIDRKTMPYYGYFQPYCAYIALFFQSIIVIFYGYSSFTPWSVSNFFSNYTMQIVVPILFIGWKVIKKTRWIKPHEVDLVWDRPIIDAYEATITTPAVGFWTEMGRLIGIRRHKTVSVE
jgi:amino acid transporter